MSETRSATVAADPVLAVIPCLNESDISGTAHCSSRQFGGSGLLIAVVDGGSTDGTQDIVARIADGEPRIRLMNNPKRIQSAGINLAVREFGKERRWLVRIDAHAEYPKGFIARLIAEAHRMHASSVVVAMKSDGADCFQRAAAVAQNSVLGTGGRRIAEQAKKALSTMVIMRCSIWNSSRHRRLRRALES